VSKAAAKKAAILGKVSPSVLEWLIARIPARQTPRLEDGFIDLIEQSIDDDALIDLLVPGAYRNEQGRPVATLSAHVALSADLHTDESAPFSYTVGVVLDGDHLLHTVRRTAGALTPGVVYFLDNRSLHGARRAHDGAPPLRFVTIDFTAYDLRDAYDRIGSQPMDQRVLRG
jgi:hypothetical protein